MSPAQKRLDADRGHVDHVEHGLVLEYEFASPESGFEVGLEEQTVLERVPHFGNEHVVTVSATHLCLVQSEVGVADEILGVRADARRNADTGGYQDGGKDSVAGTQKKGLVEHIEQSFGDKW